MSANIPVNKLDPSVKSSSKPLGGNAQNGSCPDETLSSKAPASTSKNIFNSEDYFDPTAGPMGGFRGFTEK